MVTLLIMKCNDIIYLLIWGIEKDTSFMWYSCQKCILSMESWRKIRQAQLEEHSKNNWPVPIKSIKVMRNKEDWRTATGRRRVKRHKTGTVWDHLENEDKNENAVALATMDSVGSDKQFGVAGKMKPCRSWREWWSQRGWQCPTRGAHGRRYGSRISTMALRNLTSWPCVLAWPTPTA